METVTIEFIGGTLKGLTYVRKMDASIAVVVYLQEGHGRLALQSHSGGGVSQMEDSGRLVVDHILGNWRIVWEFEDDTGGMLGQDKEDGKGEPPKDPDSWEHWAASKAILDAFPGVERDQNGFFWPTERAAKKALQAVKAVLKANVPERPMPDWALKALANGWKPPKGWKGTSS
jgi:hypothetical protein